MSGIGGIIHWDKRPVPLPQIRHMMDLVSHRGPDGIWAESREQVGLGFASLALKRSDVRYPQPAWLPDQSMAVVADAVLYNREVLKRRLGDVSWWLEEPSAAAVLLAAYERWGVEMLQYLEGDFAFAIWDRNQAQVFAARDPFSARPFFYYFDEDRFLFASEPKQLLSQPGVPIEPEDEIIGELINRRFSQLDKTFFKEIWRLKPAHYLVAGPGRVVQTRWWVPDPEKEIWFDDPQDYYDRFGVLLKSAVAKRLDSDFTVVAELSGGFDSSSVVVLADEIYRQDSNNLPPLETISYIYPKDSCDETVYIKDVVDHVNFTSNGICAANRAFSVGELQEVVWQQDSPFFIDFPAQAKQKARVIAGAGAKIQLSGIGGDELALLNYKPGDLVRSGRLLALGQLVGKYSERPWNAFALAIMDAARFSFPKNRRFRSQIQKEICDDFKNPRFHWLVESNERQSSWHGYEARHPFCDRPLVEFILAMPIEQRLKGEQYRTLQRRGLNHLLPPIIRNRDDKVDFLSYHRRVFRNEIAQLRQYLFCSEWLSEPYIPQKAAEDLFRSVSQPDNDFDKKTFSLCLALAGLEAWLRGFGRYRDNMFEEEEVLVPTDTRW